MNLSDEKTKQIENWYDTNKLLYETCAKEICTIIGKLLKRGDIQYHSITYRLKEKKSFLKKIKNKNYDNPLEQVMDLSGIRIIAYTAKDVEKICNIIKNEFIIDYKNSINKANDLEADRVGYLSIHYIAELNKTRSNLPEYEPISNIKTEIQVRTLLQHAWAEIEHDRNYKFSGVLPKEIARRFYLIAGVLEMVDREFDLLSVEIDKYAHEIRDKTERGDLDVNIDSTSLLEYMNSKFKNIKLYKKDELFEEYFIKELNNFGIYTLNDIEKIIPSDFEYIIEKRKINTTYIGILRNIMLINIDKYFQNAYKRSNWSIMSESSINVLSDYNIDVKKYLKQYNIKR